jgi:ACR3 family arsenite efflux pump ArsB
MQKHVCFLLYPIVIFVDIVGDFKSFYSKKMLFSNLFRNNILKTGVLFFHINVCFIRGSVEFYCNTHSAWEISRVPYLL